jgi:hypothetical protein
LPTAFSYHALGLATTDTMMAMGMMAMMAVLAKLEPLETLESLQFLNRLKATNRQASLAL